MEEVLLFKIPLSKPSTKDAIINALKAAKFKLFQKPKIRILKTSEGYFVSGNLNVRQKEILFESVKEHKLEHMWEMD